MSTSLIENVKAAEGVTIRIMSQGELLELDEASGSFSPILV